MPGLTVTRWSSAIGVNQAKALNGSAHDPRFAGFTAEEQPLKLGEPEAVHRHRVQPTHNRHSLLGNRCLEAAGRPLYEWLDPSAGWRVSTKAAARGSRVRHQKHNRATTSNTAPAAPIAW